MKPLITADRLRSAVAGASTEKELACSLRAHRIPFTWTTAPGYLAALVHTRSGSVYIYRAAGRSAPFRVRSAAPVARSAAPLRVGYPFQVPRWTWDD